MHLTKDTMNLIFLHTNKSQRQVVKPLGVEEDHGGDLAHFSGCRIILSTERGKRVWIILS